MILDPFGEILIESHKLEDDVVVGTLTRDKLVQASGKRYLKARRPALYGKLVEPQESVTEPGWTMEHQLSEHQLPEHKSPEEHDREEPDSNP